jgi:hypothetical protein
MQSGNLTLVRWRMSGWIPSLPNVFRGMKVEYLLYLYPDFIWRWNRILPFSHYRPIIHKKIREFYVVLQNVPNSYLQSFLCVTCWKYKKANNGLWLCCPRMMVVWILMPFRIIIVFREPNSFTENWGGTFLRNVVTKLSYPLICVWPYIANVGNVGNVI